MASAADTAQEVCNTRYVQATCSLRPLLRHARSKHVEDDLGEPLPLRMSLQRTQLARLAREIDELRQDTALGATVLSLESTPTNVTLDVSLRGLLGSPFEDGLFVLQAIVSPDWPLKGLVVSYVTPVFHPNISADGDIDCRLLKDDWSPSLSLIRVFLALQKHLSDAGVMLHGTWVDVEGETPRNTFGLSIARGGGLCALAINSDAGSLWLKNRVSADAFTRAHVAEHAPIVPFVREGVIESVLHGMRGL